MMKTAMTSGDRPDISQYALNSSASTVQPKNENERSRDIDDVIETKATPT
jgi:hypothetical protein